jgi:S1-C subfamily serine protease
MAVRIEDAAGAASAAPRPSGGRRVLFGTVPAFDYQGEGVKVDDVTADSPAAKAGIRGGDLLTHVDGKQVKNLREYAAMLREMKPGQEVQATIVRDGKTLKVRVTVVAR